MQVLHFLLRSLMSAGYNATHSQCTLFREVCFITWPTLLSYSRIWLLFIAAMFSSGCLGKNKIVKRTVQDLYQEALQSAESRPEIVRPALADVGSVEFDAHGNRIFEPSCDGIPIEFAAPPPLPATSDAFISADNAPSQIAPTRDIQRELPKKKQLSKSRVSPKESEDEEIDRVTPGFKVPDDELEWDDDRGNHFEEPPVVSTASTRKRPDPSNAKIANSKQASWNASDGKSMKSKNSILKRDGVVHASFRDSKSGRVIVVSDPNDIVDSASDTTNTDEKRITDSFQQMEIRDAIDLLTSHVPKTVVIDDSVGGVVNLEIIDEDFESALKLLLQPLGVFYAKVGERYIVAPADPDSPMYQYISKRSQYSPKFQDTASLTNMLPPRYKKFIQVSTERNLIGIDAPKPIADEIDNRLRELDKPVPQVELEAIVCVVSPDSSFRFGLDWSHRVGGADTEDLSVSMNNLGLKSAFSADGARNIFSDFAVTSAFVRLLAQEGYITIRAAPRVTAKDGEKANISINRETFFSLQPNNSSVFFQQSIQKVEAGISLEITPRVHEDMVNVKITKAEVSEDIRTQAANGDLSSVVYPIINRRTVSTEVMVRDGHTITIGGLVQRQTVDRIAKVPFFSSIPIAGKLFESIEKQEQDAEVAIFICPRIVPASSLCPDFTPHQTFGNPQ